MSPAELRTRAQHHHQKSQEYHQMARQSWKDSLRGVRNAAVIGLGGTLVTASAIAAEVVFMNGFNIIQILTGVAGVSLATGASIHFGLEPAVHHATTAIEHHGNSSFHLGARHAHRQAAELVEGWQSVKKPA